MNRNELLKEIANIISSSSGHSESCKNCKKAAESILELIEKSYELKLKMIAELDLLSMELTTFFTRERIIEAGIESKMATRIINWARMTMAHNRARIVSHITTELIKSSRKIGPKTTEAIIRVLKHNNIYYGN